MKKHIIKTLILNILLVIPTGLLFGQEQSGSIDKYSLLTEPFNLRPINMHKGQFQINAVYKLSIRTKSFDNSGDKIGLLEDGSASIRHTYVFNMRYGILEFFEVGAEMNFFKQGVRGKTRNYLSGLDFITINELNEFNGFEDIRLHASASLPFEVDIFDFSIEGGISLPTAKHEPDEPTHTFQFLGFQSYIFNYHYNNNNGIGVPAWNTSATIHLTFNKITLVSTGSFYSPFREGSSVIWDESFVNDIFTYDKTTYSYLPSESLNIFASVHYQAIGWLDLSLGFDHFQTSGGWFEQFENKYANPDKKLSYLQIGLEIQVSPLIRLNEVAGFALSGQNTDGPFYILTSLSFNMIPFIK
ncbi:MAG: hypothetical protein K8R35_03920 [Bacteroidales bacterium]|nr:hypothetical protein [Bacteroidales bacterium]